MYTTVQCLVEMVNGHLIAQSPNPAVPYSLLAEIWKWMSEKTSLEDVVVRLQPRTVPNGYKYHTWKEGTIPNNRKPLVYYCRICITTGKSETITDGPFLLSWSLSTKFLSGKEKVYHFASTFMYLRFT